MRKHARIDVRTLKRLPAIESAPTTASPAGAFKAALGDDGKQLHFIEVAHGADETRCYVSPIMNVPTKVRAE